MKFNLINEYRCYINMVFDSCKECVAIEYHDLIDRNICENISQAKTIFKAKSYLRIQKLISECYDLKVHNTINEDGNNTSFILKDVYKDGVEIQLSDDDFSTYVYVCPQCGTPYLLDDLLKLKSLNNDVNIICQHCDYKFDNKSIVKREITPGKYRHFKGEDYEVIGIAKNATNNENLNDMVVYRALYGDYQLYYRDIVEFSSRVNKIKYPESKQEFRFERIGM